MATGGHQENLDAIDQVLLCQICLNPLVNRKCRILSCLHTFCQVCLETILTRKPGREIRCSICRQTSELPTGRVSDLPLNFNIDQTNQMLQKVVQTVFCSKCCKRNEYVPASQICITCRRQICDTCRKQHDRLPGFLTHQMEQLEHGVSGDSEELCKTHKSMFCLFCRKCKVLLCSQCMTEDVHDSHTDDIQSLDAAMSEMHTSLSDRKRAVVKHLDFVKGKIEVKSRQLDHLASVEKDIIKTMDTLKSSIDKSGNDLIKELKENYITKIEQQKAHLNDMLEKGTSNLKTIEGFAVKKSVRMLDSSASWMKDTSEFEQLMSGLKSEVEIVMVKFTKQLQMSVFGKLEKTDLPPLVREPGTRDLLTPDDLMNLSKQLTHPATGKRTLVKSFGIAGLSGNKYSDVATLVDGSAVFIRESDDEILRINRQGNILSRYKPEGGEKLKSISAFNNTVVCLLDKESKFLELTVDHNIIELTTSHRAHRIKADGVCVDCSGNIILYNKKTVKKLDSRDKIMWQKTVRGRCLRVRSGLLDNKQCYLVNHYSAKKIEIWNEAGEVIGGLMFEPPKNHQVVRDMTVSHRGTFIVTHYSKTSDSDEHKTVTEYAPDGSFIRHLLTQENGVRWPHSVSCDHQGYTWITNTLTREIDIYKFS